MYLALEILNISHKAVLCLNFSDEAQRLKVNIDEQELSLQLGIPVIKTNARSKSGLSKLIDTAIKVASGETKTFHPKRLDVPFTTHNEYSEKLRTICSEISALCLQKERCRYTAFQQKLDYLFTSKLTGIPILILVFAMIFWLTAYVANYPSEWLSLLFGKFISYINDILISLNLNDYLRSFVVDGILTTALWVVSVMLPPAVIFFPLFAILEDFGYLPRVAFILDRLFSRFGVQGKQSITMLMGLGCNACAVMNCRIMSSKKDRLISIVTNSFIPCNGRIPTLIVLSSVFVASSLAGITKSLVTTAFVMALLLLSFFVTLVVSFVLSKFTKTTDHNSFILELPPYRKPDFLKVILVSLRKKVLYVLSRAMMVSVPAGAVIWLLCNLKVNNITLLELITEYINPVGVILGVDGVILTAFILGFPANEIVMPIVIMSYLSQSSLTDYSSVSMLGEILQSNGWTLSTAICTCVLCLFHFPCSTTCSVIKKETKSLRFTAACMLIPAVVGVCLCLLINGAFNLSQISF